MRYLAFLFMCFTFIATIPVFADETTTTNQKLKMAENNPVASVACKAYKMVNSGITKAIIVFLFIITGLGFFIGKISWGIVISLLIGTSLTLTSGKLVKVFVGGAGAGGGEGDVCECKYGLNSSGECNSAYNS
jgi:type IV secretory pathway VirB2 component (pilin)